MAYWILSQMKRWGYIKGEIKYKDIAEKVYLLTDAKKYMAEVGMTPPKETTKKFKVMGKEFDPAKADAYVGKIFGQRWRVLDRIEQLPEQLPLIYLNLTR